MLLRIVRLLVYAQHKRRVWILRWRRNHHFFHWPAQMLLRFRPLRKQSGRLYYDIRTHPRPVDFRGILDLKYLEASTLDADRVVGVRNPLRQVSEDRVVLQQVRQRLRVRDVVYRDELQVLVVDGCAQDIASDTAEAVDSNLDWHYFLRCGV